jgi:hypothetical protein
VSGSPNNGPSGTTPDTPGWPKGVKRLLAADLLLFGRDADNTLYWKGQKVQTVTRLAPYERWLAGIVTFLATLAALGTLASGVKDGSEHLCKVWDKKWFCEIEQPVTQNRTGAGAGGQGEQRREEGASGNQRNEGAAGQGNQAAPTGTGAPAAPPAPPPAQ